MLDKDDKGAAIGLWVVVGVITLLLFGLIGGLGMWQMHLGKLAAKPAMAAAVTAPVMAEAATTTTETLHDTPISGDLAATQYFASGPAALPEGAQAELHQGAVGACGNPGA